MQFNVFFEEIKKFKKPVNLKEWIENTIKDEKKTPGVVNLIFCSDDYLLKMNNNYLNHDYFTDVITFDYSLNNKISGDIFISIDRVKENAQRYQNDFLNEILRVIIHGILHLVGYNDKSENEKIIMTEKENIYINKYKLISF
jgi:rRNA maturation RNase YbeY